MELIGDQKVHLLDSRPDPVALAREIASTKTANKNDEAFVLYSLDTILDRYALWQRELPMIEPFYAVKCNTDKVLIRVLAALGASFDCASKEEIDIALATGVTPNQIIYANPCKTSSFISHAKRRGVTMMTYDTKEELEKVQELHPEAEMILRIAVSDPTAQCPLAVKFGAEVADSPALLKAAQKLGVKVAGISFHVGSGCNDPNAFRTAVSHTKDLFEYGKTCGFDMSIIDVGGGFPGASHHTTFESIADVIRRALDEFFPDTSKLRLIAEPGRFFAAAPATLVNHVFHHTQVPASRITKNPEDNHRVGYMYYINDGLYGSFNCKLFDHQEISGRPLFDDEEGELFPTTIWGPTCDGSDVVEENVMMRKLTRGDWILYENMGAYTTAASSTFNGFARPTPIYVISAEGWKSISSSVHI